jgi:hypothetical protein
MTNVTDCFGLECYSNESIDEDYQVGGNGSDFDRFVYLRNVLGPQRQPAEKLIPLTIIYIGTEDGRQLYSGDETCISKIQITFQGEGMKRNKIGSRNKILENVDLTKLRAFHEI